MRQIPITIAKFLSTPEKKGFNIYDKFAYLIKSIGGDDYYLCTELPEEGLIAEELGTKISEVLIAQNISYEDVFVWFADWRLLNEL